MPHVYIVSNMRLLSCLLLLFMGLLPALGQTSHLSFGAIGGVRLSNGMPTQDESRLYTVGPSAEARFGQHLAVEFNALYQRLGSSAWPSLGVGSTPVLLGAIVPADLIYLYTPSTRIHSWEFPILGKYYFGSRRRSSRLFIQTGYSFQRSWMTTRYHVIKVSAETGEITVSDARSVWASSMAVGAVFGGGFTRKVGPATFAPAFRYTRWGVRSDGANRNQAEFLLGLWF